MNVRRSLHRIQEKVRQAAVLQAAVLQAAQVINRHQAQERVLRMVAVEVINQAVHPPVMAAVVPHRPMAAAHWEAVTVPQLLLTL